MKSISAASLVLLLSHRARAAAVAEPVAAPAITQAPAVNKRDASVYGWYSAGTSDNTIIWNAQTVNNDLYTMYSSGTLYGFCSRRSSCSLFWGCSAGYMMYGATSSTYCGQFASTCSYDLLYSSVGASSPKTAYWCNPSGYTGVAIYQQTPGGTPLPQPTPIQSTPSPTTTPRRFTSPDPSTPDPTTPPSSPSSTSPIPSPEKTDKKSNNTPAIVGGVIGGIALLGAIAIAIIFLLRRKKHNNNQPPAGPPPPQFQQQQPQLQQNMYQPQPPNMMGAPMVPPPEKQPLMTTNSAYMANAPVYANAQMGQTSPSSMYPPQSPPPPQTPMQPAPQYPGPYVNELPTQRM